MEDLTRQVVKWASDQAPQSFEGMGGEGDYDGMEGGDDGLSGAPGSNFRVTKHEKNLHVMTALMVLLCRRLGDVGRLRCIVHDIVAINLPGPGAVFALSAVSRYWPEILKPGAAASNGAEEAPPPPPPSLTLVSRAIQALLAEVLAPVCLAARERGKVDQQLFLSSVYEDICHDMGWGYSHDKGPDCPFTSEEVAEEALTQLSSTDPPASEEHVAEAIRALELIACGKGKSWVEKILMSPGIIHTRNNANLVRMLSVVGREMVVRDAVGQASPELLRRLVVLFQDMIDGAGEGTNGSDVGDGTTTTDLQENLKVWATVGLLSLPGAPQGEIKQALRWFYALSSERQFGLPIPFYRKVRCFPPFPS